MSAPPLGVLGAGWVGLVTAACFADLGHDVVVRDVVEERIAELNAGRVRIYEPGLAELIERHRDRLRFTLDAGEVFERARIVFVCVGTPPTYSGDADLTAVWQVLDDIPPLDGPTTLAMKSTVPVGTGVNVRAELAARGHDRVRYVANPEFLAESTAIQDFSHADRVVVGSFETEDGDTVAALYEPLGVPIIRTDVPTAEMIKYASNAFLATKVSFINEIANVCEETGADVVQVAEGMGYDRRIGPHFLRAGIGYSGNCLVGSETVLARRGGRTELVRLDALFAELAGGSDVGLVEPVGLDVLSWSSDSGSQFSAVTVATRRYFEGEIVELRTKMGRRVQCTPDHPLVVARDPAQPAATKPAAEIGPDDWLPVSSGAIAEDSPSHEAIDLLEGLVAVGTRPEDVIVRPDPQKLRELGREAIADALRPLGPRRGAATRAHDIMRARALRLHEALHLELPLQGASVSTARSGTYVPLSIPLDEPFWRVLGLYLAEGSCSIYGGRHRLQWSFHPTREHDLVDEVSSYWESLGVKATRWRSATAANVTVSSRILAGYWLGVLGAGVGSYDHRLPDAVWDAPREHKSALVAGLWRGDGSWSYIAGGPSVVLEYGTVSPWLADGMLRLLAELGIIARLKVGRSRKSTCDAYHLVIAGAEQVEQALEFVPETSRPVIRASLERQKKRIAPTGYRRANNAAWMRVTSVTRRSYSGYVYSLEVPGPETFVTTGGLVVHNCLPKDVAALKQLAGNSGYHFQLLTAVIEVNELQKRRVVGKLVKHLGPLRGKTIVLLGLAFKPNTNDMREASSLVLAARLLAEGALVRGWDPVAIDEARPLLKGVELFDDMLEALRGADAAVIVTEWDAVRQFPYDEAGRVMHTAVLVDGRNVLDPRDARRQMFVYESIGRPSLA